jgi:hypothetical protein
MTRREQFRVWLLGQSFILPFWLIFAVYVAWTIVFLARPQVPPASYSYSQDAYQPVVSALCPGDLLTWRVTIRVEASPDNAAIPTIVRSVWGEAQHTVVVRDIPVQQTVFIASVETSSDEQYRIPVLPPGTYALYEGRRDAGRQVRGYRVPFEVLPVAQCMQRAAP